MLELAAGYRLNMLHSSPYVKVATPLCKYVRLFAWKIHRSRSAKHEKGVHSG